MFNFKNITSIDHLIHTAALQNLDKINRDIMAIAHHVSATEMQEEDRKIILSLLNDLVTDIIELTQD